MHLPRTTPAAAAIRVCALAAAAPAQSPPAPLSRGAYLATIMDCGGCHTGGALAVRLDPRLHLAGSGIGFGIPDLGVFYPPNLTPDRDTGLGAWSESDIISAIRKGERPDGRVLAPVMPVRNAAPPMAGVGETPPAPFLAVKTPPDR